MTAGNRCWPRLGECFTIASISSMFWIAPVPPIIRAISTASPNRRERGSSTPAAIRGSVNSSIKGVSIR